MTLKVVVVKVVMMKVVVVFRKFIGIRKWIKSVLDRVGKIGTDDEKLSLWHRGNTLEYVNKTTLR